MPIIPGPGDKLYHRIVAEKLDERGELDPDGIPVPDTSGNLGPPHSAPEDVLTQKSQGIVEWIVGDIAGPIAVEGCGAVDVRVEWDGEGHHAHCEIRVYNAAGLRRTPKNLNGQVKDALRRKLAETANIYRKPTRPA